MTMHSTAVRPWVAATLLLVLAGCARKENAGDTAARPDSPAVEDSAMGGSDRMPPAAGPATFSGPDTLWNAPAPPGPAVAVFGDTPQWTPTTTAAANRGTTGGPVSVTGEVVDVSCYLQLGKRGEKHKECGSDCVKHGAPIGVVDADNQLYIVMAEEHDPRRYGNIALKEAMLPYMAQTVEVNGMLTEREGVRTIYVLGYTVGDNPDQPKGE